jgi:holo-[acyl-carrier protein] synthase
VAPHAPRIGLDLVDIPRFQEALASREARWRERVFTEEEWALAADRPDRAAALAARFAAKEAAFKALGTGWGQGVRWTDVAVRGGGRTAPELVLEGRAAELAAEQQLALVVSLTHTETTASAVVLAHPAPTSST